MSEEHFEKVANKADLKEGAMLEVNGKQVEGFSNLYPKEFCHLFALRIMTVMLL
jgi:hypothetical protein